MEYTRVIELEYLDNDLLRYFPGKYKNESGITHI